MFSTYQPKLFTMRNTLFSISIIILFFINSLHVDAHCEIPCGIYNDQLRIELILEDITTIEKSITMISELSAAEKPDYNQIVRWVTNKDEHATKIQTVATQYFMFQRIKITEDPELMKKNNQMLKQLHELCVYAMKAKQSLDIKNIELMKASTDKFAKLYLGENYNHNHTH